MHDLEGLIVTLSTGLILAVAGYFVRVARLRRYADSSPDDLRRIRRDSLAVFAAALIFYFATHYVRLG